MRSKIPPITRPTIVVGVNDIASKLAPVKMTRRWRRMAILLVIDGCVCRVRSNIVRFYGENGCYSEIYGLQTWASDYLVGYVLREACTMAC